MTPILHIKKWGGGAKRWSQRHEAEVGIKRSSILCVYASAVMPLMRQEPETRFDSKMKQKELHRNKWTNFKNSTQFSQSQASWIHMLSVLALSQRLKSPYPCVILKLVFIPLHGGDPMHSQRDPGPLECLYIYIYTRLQRTPSSGLTGPSVSFSRILTRKAPVGKLGFKIGSR